MGIMDQPTAYFGGGYVIRGDIEFSGSLLQDPISIGADSVANDDTMAVGVRSEATGTDAISVGKDSKALSRLTAAFGYDAQATGQDATAIGSETRAPSNWNTVVGYGAGTADNGENVVLVGRLAEAQGNDAVAIGEVSRANGNQSTVVGRDTDALQDNASVFGQGSTADGVNTTVVGQGVTVNTDDSTTVGVGVNVTGSSATAVGVNSEATANNATAIGNGAVAEGAGAIALGENTTVSLASAIGFGDRDISLQESRSVLYPTNAGAQTLVNLPVDDTISEGVRQEFTFDIGGEPIFIVRAESDGAGGIQNAVGEIKGSFALDGDTNEVDDVITGDISIEDGSGTEQIGLDATVSPVKIDLHNNRLINFGIRSGEDITYPDDSGIERLVNFNVTSGPAAGDEMSYSFAVDDTDIAKIFAEADGGGGIQNPLFRLLEDIDVNSNSIIDGGTTIWDAANNYVPTSSLEFTDVTINGSNGLSAGTASLGGSTTISISGNLSLDSSLEAVDGETIWDETNGYIPSSALQSDTISVAGTDVSLGSSVSISLSDLSAFDLSGNDLSDGTTTIWNSSSGYVPTSILENDSVTISAGTNLSTGGSVSLGNSVTLDLADPINLSSLNVDSIGDNGQGFIDFSISGTKRAELDSSGNLDIEGSLTEGAAL